MLWGCRLGESPCSTCGLRSAQKGPNHLGPRPNSTRAVDSGETRETVE